MNTHSEKNDNKKDNNRRTAKSIGAIPLAGIVVAAAFLTGLSLINNYQPAIAQNMTGNATTTTPSTTGGGTSAQSVCAPTQTGGGGGQNATTNATATTTGGSSANATTGNTTTATTAPMTANATTAGGGNQTTSSPTQLIEQACMAALNNDTQGVLMNLNLALNALGGNTTTSEDGEDEDGEDEDGEDEGEAEG
jgi:hypothetical protein